MQLTFSDGNKIPTLGFGTWKLTGSPCATMCKKAIELGYRHIDTAMIYQNEEEVGKGIAGFPRKNLFLTSKVWPDHFDY